MLGSGAVVWDYGTPTLTGPCLPRAAVVSHLCIPAEIRPVDKSTSTRTTPLHMGWTHAHALPTPTPTPRRAMLSYALPVPVPSHSVSIPLSPGPSGPAEACGDVDRQSRAHALGIGYLLCVEHRTPCWTRCCLRGGVLSISPISQVPC